MVLFEPAQIDATDLGFVESDTLSQSSSLSDGSCGATLTDYPMLFNSTDADLAHRIR